MKPCIYLHIFCFLLQFILAKSNQPLVAAIYVFGDSLIDSGNNNYLPTNAKANYPPYGVNFPTGPTGRFTNGRTSVDFIAEALGLPLVPPYLGLSEKERQEIRTGINYGSGSAGILPETGTILGPNLSLETQLKLFTETVQKYLSNTFKGPNELSDHFSKSIFYINIGSNDFIYTYLTEPDLSNPRYKPTVLSNDLTERLSQNLKALYMLGARKFVVANLGLIGCIPYIVNRRKPKGVCVEELNQFVEVYNSKLIELLKGQSSTLPGSTFVTLKSYELSILMAPEVTKSGINDPRPCCVDAGNGSLPCTPNVAPCKTPNTHYFFDIYHPTEGINSIAARHFFSDSSVSVPLTIEQLAQA